MESENKDLLSISILSRQLPDLVVELLLNYLDIFALKALRLVCKTTKSWVQTPELLRYFLVRITGNARLNDVLGAPDPVPWNTFVFVVKNCFNKADIQGFLAAYGDLVVHLEFNWKYAENMDQAQENVLPLLSGCPHLESLKSYELNLGPLKSETRRLLLENWKNHMRHFNVEYLLSGSITYLEEMTFFDQIWSTSTQLETLTVPHFSYDYYEMYYDYAENFRNLVITPLLDTIAQGRLRSMTVPYHSCLDDTFLRLILACRENGTIFHSHCNIILEKLSPHNLSVLDIIGNLDSITDTIIRQRLTNVRSICLRRTNFDVRNDSYTMPAFSLLNELDLNLLNRNIRDLDLDLFIHRLAKLTRPTVKVLRITYPIEPPLRSMNISPVDLCTSFVNLRVLHVKEWESEDEQWLKLWPLVARTLVELQLIDCMNQRDRGILGDDLNHAAIRQLKNLRKLKYYNVHPRNGKITKKSFIHAFCHMQLRSFSFAQVTLQSCSESLMDKTVMEAMWNGPFGNTIEKFYLDGKNMILERPPANQELTL